MGQYSIRYCVTVLPFYRDKYAKEILWATHRKIKENDHLVVTDFAWSYEWGGFTFFSKPMKKLGDIFFFIRQECSGVDKEHNLW